MKLNKAVLASFLMIISQFFTNVNDGFCIPTGFTKLAKSDDFTIVLYRLKMRYIKDAVPFNASNALKSMDRNGAWTDITYEDSSQGSWSAIEHLIRISKMSVAYSTPTNVYYRNSKVLASILKGLDFWVSKPPLSKNWWWNTIGAQIQLQKILVLMYDELPRPISVKTTALLVDMDSVSPNLLQGANLTWYASQQIIKGLIQKKEVLVKNAIKEVENEIVLGGIQGIQNDYSFHQHGSQLYNGGYGLQFLYDCLTLAKAMHETAFEFEKSKVQTLSRFLLEGIRFMSRYGTVDYSSLGRDISRKNQDRSKLMRDCCDMLDFLVPEKSREYALFKSSINQNEASFIGNKYFWLSDFMTHQRKDYYFSIKMVSDRTDGTEIGNGENLKGSWLPFGATYLLKSGQEYKDVFPVWDWTKIPGVTSYNSTFSANVKTNTVKAEKQINVAGVSNSVEGIAVMELDHIGLSGSKSWFCFDSEIVALGTGISSSDKLKEVNTTIEQSLLDGEVVIGGNDKLGKISNGTHALNNVLYVCHGKIGYVFPNRASLNITNSTVVGDWNSINLQYDKAKFSKSIFSLWIRHGVQPKNVTYSYVIVPVVKSLQDLEAYARNLPIRIVRNDINAQAVSNTKAGIYGVVFHKKGRVVLDDKLTVNVDSPCVILIDIKSSKVDISISTLGRRVNSISTIVNFNNKTYNRSVIFNDSEFGMSKKIILN